MEKWNGKIAVVTGAFAGIGEAIVKDFARNGITVIGLDKRSVKADEIVQKFGHLAGIVHSRQCDITDLGSVKEAFEWIAKEFGVIQILINNAGIVLKGNILDEDEETTEKLKATINTNFTGLVYCTREAVRLIKKSEDYGLIVNINSVLGHHGPFFGNPINIYSPTKFAVTAVSEVLRQELIVSNNDKIRVTNLSPSWVKTETVVSGGFAETKEEFYDLRPHLLTENVSQAVLFLLSTPYNVNISQLTIKAVGEKA